jgi:hypothetical protein
MAFTSAELSLVNQALGRIGTTIIKSTENGLATCNNYVQAALHYPQTRDSLLRSFRWNFAVGQSTLSQISTLELDTRPSPSAWIAGDDITGLSSEVTAQILAVVSETEYEIVYLSGSFTDGERITNAVVYDVYWEGIPLTWEDANITYHAEDDEAFCSAGYPVVTAILPDFHYSYQYQLPSDFDRLTRNHHGHYRWTIQGNRLLSSEDSVEIEYVKKAVDPSEWDSLFTEILILSLALKLLPVLAGSQTTTFRQDLKQDYLLAMSRARAVNSSETNNTGRSNWNLARYGSGKSGSLDPTTLH